MDEWEMKYRLDLSPLLDFFLHDLGSILLAGEELYVPSLLYFSNNIHLHFVTVSLWFPQSVKYDELLLSLLSFEGYD